MKYVQLADCQLAYRELGMGEPTTVLVHGNIANQNWWNLVFEALAQFSHVITVDLRGVGASSRPAAGYQIEQYAQDLIAFLETLEVKGSCLVGHSLGGAVVVQAALSAPSLVERLILINPAPIDGLVTPEEYYPLLAQLTSDRAQVEARLRGVMPHFDHGSSFFQQLVDEAMRDAHATVANARSLAQFDRSEMADRLTLPVRILYGEQDLLITREMMERTLSLLPAGELIRIPQVGHSIMLEDPEACVRLITQFTLGRT